MFDKDATDALTMLLEQGPTTVQNVLNDWTMEEFEGKTVLSTKERTTSRKTIIYVAT